MIQRIKALFKETRKDVELKINHDSSLGHAWADVYVVHLYGDGPETTEYKREYIKSTRVEREDIGKVQAKMQVLLHEDSRSYFE